MDYAARLDRELKTFAGQEVVHKLPSVRDYWSDAYNLPRLRTLGYTGFRDMFIRHIVRVAQRTPGTVEIVSIGAGNGDFEVELAGKIEQAGVTDYRFACLDINPEMLARGRGHAAQAGRGEKFAWVQADFNDWAPDQTYHIVIANHALHHVVELERLFDAAKGALDPCGYFLVNDMIGRNGHMRWPEVEYFLRPIWRSLQPEKRHNHQLKRTFDEFYNHDCSTVGFEGIRAQDILPLLIERFHFPFFYAFGALISPFVGRSYGPNFDANRAEDRVVIDHVATLDQTLIDAGVLKPTQMFGALSVSASEPAIAYGRLTPAFCLRQPDAPPPFLLP